MPVRRRNSWDTPEYRARQAEEASRRRLEVSRVRAQLVDYTNFELTQAVRDALGEAFEGIDRSIARYFTVFGDAFTDVGRIGEVHRRVGLQAQRSILGAYDQLVTARSGPAARSNAAYRARPARLSGRLRNALKNPGHVEVGGTYLRFLDVDILDSEAAHWYRINFGVGQRGSQTRPGIYELVIGGAVVGQLGFGLGGDIGGPSRHPMILPPGFWVGGGERVGGDVTRRGMEGFFLPGEISGVRGRPTQARTTRGIAGRQFLDAGIRRIARELPNAYEDIARNAHARASGVDRESVDVVIASPRRRLRVVQRPIREPRRYRRSQPL